MPTERAKLLELAKRCEAASGQLRGLDYLIFCAQVPVGEKAYWDPDDPKYHFTASIDAAMSLAKANWLVGFKGLWDGKAKAANAFIDLYTVKDDGLFWGDHIQACAATPALALTAASLRARATENTNAPDT